MSASAVVPPPASAGKQLLTFLEMIKFQHTVFALPFAAIGMMLAANGLPTLRVFLLVILCCVLARTAAMSFNRWADADIDARNPRTANRAIPAGQLSAGRVLAIAIVCGVGFCVGAAMLNALAGWLSPVALVVLFGYSFMKRVSWLSHIVLGLALALAPIGAWIGVRGTIDAVPILLGLGVLFWTTGFDLIYACQDVDCDRREGLWSVPSRLGVDFALRSSSWLHVACVVAFWSAGFAAGMGGWYYAGIVAVAALLFVEHRIVNPADLSRIDVAFFTINMWVGMTMLAFTALDLLT